MSTMRIGGLASGMDIDSIVEKLMVAERAPLDKLEQKKQIYEWQRDAYREINTKLTTFDTYLADNFFLKSLNTKTATSSNEQYVSAVATNAASGTLTIENVSQLAKAARAISNKVDGVTGTSTIAELFAASGVALPPGGQQYIEIRAIQKDGTLAAEAVKIEYSSDMTINDFVKKLNSSNAGVTAIFENGKLSITANHTGRVTDGDSEIVIDSGSDLFAAFNFDNPNDIVTQRGTNAIFTVNGIETERSTNTFSIAGYTLTLKETFNTEVSISSSTNVDEIINRIKDFVKTYNELIKDLNSKITEQKYRGYPPLTSLQREEMEDKEIELWEQKAKSGLLRNDDIIREGLASLRSLIYESNPAVSNPKYNTLFSIGIMTSKNYLSGGTLEIDEDKLRKALEEDPEAVAQLLTMTGDKNATVTVNGETKAADTRGYLRKIRDEINKIELKIEKRAGRASMNETQYTLGSYLRDINKRIEEWKNKLITIETRYWNQFTRMEKMINEANSQSSMLLGQYFNY
ncbi:flagellar hook-associated protein 2 [Ureibacillus sp. FSL K6-8385]|uniref:Flagellar hook-associated protein 2 n=2 Tax=Bacillati TaxID=1783272 RepID=A0A540V5K2_9BACL|nr:flagellar hook-associated protein 2 [Ureibacillus terrenus]MED3660916.1 flagellar hook-associated protein 2 [Ureibacillus terrenus]MED3763072.1 flagellar hook-associated protein 2 [Ureibacillus terrenus]TQE91413.1 flagellar hook-associated protein 2 [Ureibacillus terrenus]